MTSDHETRTTIQLKPVELGRMTLELVDSPNGLRAHVSAEDPSVVRFLERNVQLMENEARLQGVGQMSFSVGADVSGGLGRDAPQQPEVETFFRKNVDWNNPTQHKPRSSRELDTSA
jgi:flagellar hook-length control protein FliK